MKFSKHSKPISISSNLVEHWVAWPSKNKFYCSGKCLSGPDRGPFILSVSLITIPAVLFYAFVNPQLWVKVSPVLGFILLFGLASCLSSLFIAGFIDPGILPRRKPPVKKEDSYFDGQKEKKEILVFDEVVVLKYFDTCQIYRPPRTSHCSICDNCVEKFDHHCPWVGNCVGKRNYRFFLIFLYSTTFNLLYVFGLSVLSIVLHSLDSGESGSSAAFSGIAKSPVSAILTLYCFFLIWSLFGMASYHSYLACKARTTNEDVKETYEKKTNYYDKGCWTNCNSVWCPPWYPSLIFAKKMIYRDGREPPSQSLSFNDQTKLLV